MSSATLPQIARHRVRIGTYTIGYEVVGEGAPVVLVHGLSGSTHWWHRNVFALAEQFQVYVVDLVGFGASRGSAFVLAEAAELLGRWMDAIGLERASVAGHSMGGYIAADLAATQPERVERLLLVDAAVMPFGRNYVQHGIGLMRELLHLPPAFLPILIGDALRAGPLTLWAAGQEIMRADLREKLANLGMPTLIVWGGRDDVVPLALGKLLAQAIPHSSFAVIDRAGHNAMWDCSAAFNQIALRFLAGEPIANGETRLPCK